ncbi:MAG: hypothetical protein ACPG6B_04200 [Oceanihabitans sp.]
MKTLFKLSKKVNNIVEEPTIINRHVLHFCNSKYSLFNGAKRFAH